MSAGDFIQAIQSTPIPTVLILAGLFFLLLGFVNKLGGIIEVSSEQKKLTMPVGFFVLTLGLALSFTTNSEKPTSSSSPIPSASPSVSLPTPQLSPSQSSSSDTPIPTSTPRTQVASSSPSNSPRPISTESSLNQAPPIGMPAANEVRAIINDPDGYTNIRSGQGVNYKIIGRISKDEVFYTIPQQGDWWPVRTTSNQYGYVHRSKIEI